MKHVVPMVVCAVLLMLAIFAGCQSRESPLNTPRPGATETPATAPAPIPLTHRRKDNTVYYDHPAQARPPNGTIKKGTRVAVVQPSGSYTLIWAEDGTRGYVATGALELLRPRRLTAYRVSPADYFSRAFIEALNRFIRSSL